MISLPLVKTPAAADNRCMERSGPRRNPTDRVCSAAGSLHIFLKVYSQYLIAENLGVEEETKESLF